jgi:hypothetical protein
LLEQHGHFRRRPPLRPGQKGQLHGKNLSLQWLEAAGDGGTTLTGADGPYN